MKYFDKVHPAVAASYFLSVLLISVFAASPILPISALLGGIAFYLTLNRGKRIRRDIITDILLFLLVAASNPLFVHNGVTPLFFLNGKAVTLEAALGGVGIAVMLLSAVYWFRCFNIIMTSDKLLFLFGKLSPKAALLLSSALRFVPTLKSQAQKIRSAQTTMGVYASDSLSDRLKAAMRTYSALITWSLENAVDTGSSMKSRGYGLKGRTHFSLFRFRRSDLILLAAIAVADTAVVAAMASGRLDFEFYPRIAVGVTDFWTAFGIAAFCILSFLPFILEIKEELQWRYYRSKI